MNNNTPPISTLFEPRGVAVIGASTKPSKIGYKICENIVAGGYTGKLYPVNPSGGEILGHEIYPAVTDIAGDVDVAVIAIPAKFVFDAVKTCAEKGVHHLVIITSGFSEVGNLGEEREIVAYAREHGMRVLGPNIFGLYSCETRLNATFGPKEIRPGNVAIVTQSGAIGIAMVGKTKVENIGLSAIVSVGNKSDLDEGDLLEYLIDHEPTEIILMYMEGVRDGDQLIRVLQEVTKKKPVIVIKSGRSKRGAMAAASHTGSLAGTDDVFDSVVRQCGVIRADGIQEGLEWCKYLGSAAHPTGREAVIITNGGGIGVLATDACEQNGVDLFDDQKVLEEAFAKACPSFGSFKNPVDITGEATAEDYDACLQVALARDDIHAVICLGCETAVFNAQAFTKIIKDRYPEYRDRKPIVFSLVGGEEIEQCIRDLRNENVPIFGDVDPAISCLGALYRQYRHVHHPPAAPVSGSIDAARIREVIRGARAENRTFLLAHEGQAVMAAAGVTTPQSIVARNIKEAVAAAAGIGYPVVMKVVSRDIIHKSDAGGLALNLQDETEVIEAYESILYRCRQYKPDALIEGVEVAEMVQRNVETIVGARRDPAFGPVVMFGLGGIYVEVMKDVTFRAFPLDQRTVDRMISSIRSYPLLLGVRGEDPKDIPAVAAAIVKVGTILSECPDISDIEINPLIVYDEDDGVKAVDVRILLTKPEETA